MPIWRVVTKWPMGMASNTIKGTNHRGIAANLGNDRIGY
jgi:hypothetical protein